MNTWEELNASGFSIIDQHHRVAVKSVPCHEDETELVKEILINAYIDYLIQQRKENV